MGYEKYQNFIVNCSGIVLAKVKSVSISFQLESQKGRSDILTSQVECGKYDGLKKKNARKIYFKPKWDKIK